MGFAESLDDLLTLQLSEPFSFTKGCKVNKIQAKAEVGQYEFRTALYDLKNDPGQIAPMEDEKTEKVMMHKMTELMKANDCPEEQFE